MKYPMDLQTLRSLTADQRQWISYGTVCKASEDGQPSVEFDEEYGQVFVHVSLQPSGVEVRSRVASHIAGNGEGSYFPFIEGDEVIVVVPEGNERSGCCVIGRLNNSIDKFPTMVSGNETKDNKFAFQRTRTPFIVETGASYVIRHATTGAAIGIDSTGGLIINGGDKAFLAIKPDLIGLQNEDGDCLIQIGVSEKYIAIEAAGTKLRLVPDGISTILTPGILGIGTSGSSPVGHGCTIEQVIGLIVSLFAQIGLSPGGSAPLTGTTLAAAIVALLPTAIPAAAATPLLPSVTTALQLALASPPDPLGIKPGCGIAGLLLG